MDDHDSLYAACLESDDDTPRLAYADWLEENPRAACPDCHGRGGVKVKGDPNRPDHFLWHGCPACEGTGNVVDAGRVARAELIRLQCELARIGTGPDLRCSESCAAHDAYGQCPMCWRDKRHLFGRQAEILAATFTHKDTWERELATCPACRDSGQPGKTQPYWAGNIDCLACKDGDLLKRKARSEGFDREGPDVGVDWSNRNGFPCTCQWASAIHGDECPEHGKVGVSLDRRKVLWQRGFALVVCRSGEVWEWRQVPCGRCKGEGELPDYVGQVRLGTRACPNCQQRKTVAGTVPTPWAVAASSRFDGFWLTDASMFLEEHGGKFWWRDAGVYDNEPRIPDGWCPKAEFDGRDDATYALAVHLARGVRGQG